MTAEITKPIEQSVDGEWIFGSRSPYPGYCIGDRKVGISAQAKDEGSGYLVPRTARPTGTTTTRSVRGLSCHAGAWSLPYQGERELVDELFYQNLRTLGYGARNDQTLQQAIYFNIEQAATKIIARVLVLHPQSTTAQAIQEIEGMMADYQDKLGPVDVPEWIKDNGGKLLGAGPPNHGAGPSAPPGCS